MKYCPLCGQKVDEAFSTAATEAFTHTDPLIGTLLWGAYSSPKQLLCQDAAFVHFKTGGDRHRLVMLGREDEPSMVEEVQAIYDAEQELFDSWFEEEEDAWWEDDDYEFFQEAEAVDYSVMDDLPF